MDSYWPVMAVILGAVNLALLGLLIWRRPRLDSESLRRDVDAAVREVRRIETAFREEARAQRDEAGLAAGNLRKEISGSLNAGLEGLLKRQAEAQQSFNESAGQTRTDTGKSLKDFQQM